MTIMARRGEKGGEHIASPTPMVSTEVKDEDGEVDGRHAAAQDVIAAMNEAHPAKLMGALSNFIDLHNAMASTEEPIEDEE